MGVELHCLLLISIFSSSSHCHSPSDSHPDQLRQSAGIKSLFFYNQDCHCIPTDFWLCHPYTCQANCYTKLLFITVQPLLLLAKCYVTFQDVPISEALPCMCLVSLGTRHSALFSCSDRHYIWRSWTCEASYELSSQTLAPFPITCGILVLQPRSWAPFMRGESLGMSLLYYVAISRQCLVPFPDPLYWE